MLQNKLHLVSNFGDATSHSSTDFTVSCSSMNCNESSVSLIVGQTVTWVVLLCQTDMNEERHGKGVLVINYRCMTPYSQEMMKRSTREIMKVVLGATRWLVVNSW